MLDGQVTSVEGSNLNVQFLGNASTGTDATSYQKTKSQLESGSVEPYRYSPLIVGATTGLLSTYALINLWPERKSIGIALFGSGLWSAYNGVKSFR